VKKLEKKWRPQVLNKVTILGRLGKDPELKTLQNGSVANLSVATTEKWTDKDGQKQERTEWHRVNVWGKLAEICAQNLSKGRTVYVEGKLQTRSWDDNGVKKFATEVIADKVIFLDQPKPAQQSGGGHGYPPDDDSSPF
jgi:single-strand DNA-binding protein